MSGGEAPEAEREILTRLSELIAAEEDVYILHAIEADALQPGRYLYMIETPFETWPKYVVGRTNADLSEVQHLYKCGAHWSVEAAWNDILLGREPSNH